MPPGGYEFVDPRTGQQFGGLDVGYAEQKKRILKHRQANPKSYPPDEPAPLTWSYIGAELQEYTCRRLNNDPKWCQDGTALAQPQEIRLRPLRQKNPAPNDGKCPKCGTELQPRYCKVCSGLRVVGWRCGTCNEEFSRGKR